MSVCDGVDGKGTTVGGEEMNDLYGGARLSYIFNEVRMHVCVCTCVCVHVRVCVHIRKCASAVTRMYSCMSIFVCTASVCERMKREI